MAELLFIATTIFVAYVLYTVLGGDKAKPETAAEPVATKADKPVEAAKPAKAQAKAKAEPKAEKKAEPAAAESAQVSSSTATDSLKNPKTGEVAKLPSSYSFAKRWIKDALVEEGLLDKVYKNNEIDDAVAAKIQAALKSLKAMEKYN